jgi:hypothetical protein
MTLTPSLTLGSGARGPDEDQEAGAGDWRHHRGQHRHTPAHRCPQVSHLCRSVKSMPISVFLRFLCFCCSLLGCVPFGFQLLEIVDLGQKNIFNTE